jgi:hypothetical protein
VRVPSQAMIFNKDGLSAAVVADGKVQFRELELDADNGADVEVRAGLLPGDRVILSQRLGRVYRRGDALGAI